MAQNICNICGANYEYKNGKWVCPACGAYKPEELSNEEVTLLYNASQKIRLALFDDAEEQYKDIVSKYPDNPDGYWGLVLAKYGIKYEQDYDGKMIPSCYAASYESVLTDKNYLKAIELADKDNRKYYEEQANKIEKIRREWINKASKEEPYDIFISYKDTEKENGTERTKDSYDALELYTMLSKLGYRVFYSRESLKDKTGEKYEPYIFNALNTAHIMIVYGSKPEYIESTWIKNEWMRFYKRIKLGKKQPNALLVINNGFNPAELPSPLSKMQNLDRNRIDFSRELESYCKRVIKAATTVLPKIERVEVKAKQGKVGKIVKIEAVELNSRTVQKTEIVREEVEKREIGNYTVSKLTANAQNELKIAEMQLSTANFDEAGKRFNTFLLKNPKNGRALTGKLLAENKSKDLDGFSSVGVQNFAEWKLLEQVLLFSEKSVSGKILKSLCDEILRSFNTGDYGRARDIYSQVSAYEDSAVTEMRKSVCDLAKGLIGKNDDTAKYFIDGYLLYEQDEDKFLSQIRNIVGISIEKGDFNFAKKYSEDWLKYENYDLSANYSALKIKYKVKTLTELFTKTESNNAYSEIDEILHCLNEESAAACFKDICDRVNTLLSADNFAKQVYAYIDKFFRYNINGRSEKIKQFLTFIANKPSKEFASVFDLLLSLSDFNTEEYSLYTLKFADNSLKNGDFDLADKYYDKVNELHETALSWEGKLKCRLKVKNDIEYSANIQNLTDFKIIENILSLSENDGKRYEFLSRIIGYVYSALKTSKTDTAKLVAVFENLLSYVPKDFDDKIIEWLFKFARFLKNNDEFDLAEKLYAIIINYDAENHVAYWEMLQAKLRCKDENSVIKQYNLISDFQEFQNALVVSAKINSDALKHYTNIQHEQIKWIEEQEELQVKNELKKRRAKKRNIIIAIGVIVGIIIACTCVFWGVQSYNRNESKLRYNSVDGGLSVRAGKYYTAEETLVIPYKVDNKFVIEIKAYAFKNHTEIKKVILPMAITKIGDGAFEGCVNLESVEFKDILEASANTQANANGNNGISLFSPQTFNTVSFATVNTTDSIKLSVIGAKAFKGCEKLQTFELNYGLKTIGDEAFAGTGLKEVTIPNTVAFVGKAAFENCKDLVNIEVGDKDQILQTWDTDWNKGNETKVKYSFRVFFNYNGADVETIINSQQFVVFGKTYSFPVPTKTGYSFVGWYFGDVKLTDNNGLSLNVWHYQDGGTVKAVWGNTIEYAISYNFGGGTVKEAQIPSDALLYNNHYYYIYNTNKTWEEAKSYCESLGGHLATITSSAENNFIATYLGSNYYYIGGYKDGSKWKWVTGEEWNYTNWNSGEPSNQNGIEDKLEFWTNKKWNDVSNGGTNRRFICEWETSDQIITTYTIETETFALPELAKEGYSFIGWTWANSDVPQKNVVIMKGSSGNKKYIANWQANENILHFDANGGSGTMVDKTVKTDATTTLPTNTFTRSGYVFKGWAVSENGTKVYNNGASYKMGNNPEYTLYAVWEIEIYDITYNLDGGIVSGNPYGYTIYSATFILNNPTKDGYTFLGWSGTDIVDKSFNVTIEQGSVGNRNYYANFGKNDKNIVLLNITDNGNESVTVKGCGNSYCRLPANTFTKDDYEFKGWSSSQFGEVEYYDRDLFFVGENENYNLFAVWEDRTDWIAISTAEEFINIRNDTTKKYYLTKDIDLNGYNWETIANFSGILDGNGKAVYNLNIVSPKVITKFGQDGYGYPVYELSYYLDLFYQGNVKNLSIEYNGYSSSSSYPRTEKKYTTTYKYYLYVGIVSGENCYIINRCDELIDNTSAIIIDKSIMCSDDNSYGNYMLYIYNNDFRVQKINSHEIVELKQCMFEKLGYTFIGWTLSDGGVVKYHAGDEFYIPIGKSNITLYPVWQANTNEVIFNANGGNGTMASQQMQTDVTTDLNANTFTKMGYHFIGWATSANGTVVYENGASYTMGTNASYTLYAVWEQNTNEIIFNATKGSGTMANQQALTDTVVTLNQCTFTAPTGYYFAGWSEDPNGNADYTDCSSFSVGTSSTYTLYAIWKMI